MITNETPEMVDLQSSATLKLYGYKFIREDNFASTDGHTMLQNVTRSHKRSHDVTKSQGHTHGHTMSQCHKVIHMVTQCRKIIHTVIHCDNRQKLQNILSSSFDYVLLVSVNKRW